ncbi:DUF3120 domain-containing protein [Oscillatoria sp. CS-180]|uniref:DUF3120 domain-containing protein n=1 Tax=Oscillatoria sp. CS-180 TaxID=3021720 RepID=UPI0023303BC1|nr:DUF3120 domain-containing protein [Oscillatoria sp. CS-180]MDB9526626.1 DUF3120 domain-containing protein [Oscillatoria sp. CS-180]
MFWAAVFLVVVPVFFQAPLVRSLPWLSLTLTGTWLLAGISLSSRASTQLWGDLLIGFTWTWLAGSLYWGWLRSEPFLHLPIEALGLPIALILLCQGKGRIGSYFFLGSLLGTAITDLYVYWTDLLPMWRQVMNVDPEWVPTVLKRAAKTLQNPTDFGRGLLICTILLIIGIVPLRSKQLCWWAFSGAVLSTLVVDLLFLTSALCA